MLWPKVAGGAAFAAAAVVVANTSNADEKSTLTHTLRPKELPIYSTINASTKNTANSQQDEQSIVSSTIEDGVRVVREGACSLVGSVQVEKQAIDNFISTGKAHSQGAIDYLNEPSNGIYRAGAIGVGALSGYLLGIRRGFFRKLIYSSAGGVGVASLCYPKEAAVYSNQALAEAKVYATILYNFAYGVKPGDEPKPLPIPSSMKEFYGSICHLLFAKKD